MGLFKCRICGEEKQYTTLFRWEVPLAADVRDEIEDLEKYPLEPVVCLKCGHVQLKETLDVDMYSNYLYTASFAGGFQQYIQSLVDDIGAMELGSNSEKRIVEIGSSNGYFLKQIKTKGWNVLGFEPAATFAMEANESGVYTENMYFGDSASLEIVENWGNPDVVVMRHVLEHLDEPQAIIEAISRILKEGYLIIEVPYLAKEVQEKQFYAFYHEHLSYFSVRVLDYLLSKHGFEITDVKENSLGGGSVTIYAYKGDSRVSSPSPTVSAYLESEKEQCSVEKIVEFSTEVTEQITKIKNLVKSEQQNGNKIAVWGVGQRGVTLLNICELTSDDLAYAIDVNENYWWKYVPGADVQIVPPSYLSDHFVEVIIILSTGYANEIISENNDYLSRGGRFLKIIE